MYCWQDCVVDRVNIVQTKFRLFPVGVASACRELQAAGGRACDGRSRDISKFDAFRCSFRYFVSKDLPLWCAVDESAVVGGEAQGFDSYGGIVSNRQSNSHQLLCFPGGEHFDEVGAIGGNKTNGKEVGVLREGEGGVEEVGGIWDIVLGERSDSIVEDNLVIHNEGNVHLVGGVLDVEDGAAGDSPAEGGVVDVILRVGECAEAGCDDK